ncbi:hypothetical protein FACS1894151_03860 [Spirochaetia bacterium]|nr:hypothetical protein FACS1894151_03860 [Spirochaetia bacterium]
MKKPGSSQALNMSDETAIAADTGRIKNHERHEKHEKTAKANKAQKERKPRKSLLSSLFRAVSVVCG